MSSSHNFVRWFRGAGPSPGLSPGRAQAAPRTTRRCLGLAEFTRDLRGSGEQKPCVLDLGPTSPANINFLTDRNVRFYNEDLLRAAHDPNYMKRSDDGLPCLDLNRFFAENLSYPESHFDAVLFWAVTDYLPEALVKPVVEKIHSIMKPKGNLFAFFHTKDAGAESPYCRYHVVQPDTLEIEPEPGFRIQRIFNTRHVENLFKDFASRKFFLGRDNIREVLVVR